MSQPIDQAEALRQQAVNLLLAERQDIDRKLAQMGADGSETPPPAKPRTCGVCGSSEHSARFHKNRRQGGEESSAIVQGATALSQTPDSRQS